MRILGLDPGKRNAFWVLFTPLRDGARLIATGQLDAGPDLSMVEKLPLLHREIRRLLRKTKPTLVYAERFVPRPGFGMGNSAEVVNLLLGMLWVECKSMKIPLTLVMPSTHKTWLRKSCNSTAQELFPYLNEHQADAFGLALYGQLHRAETDAT